MYHDISSTIIMLREFDQSVPAHKTKVPREDLENTMNPALTPVFMVTKSCTKILNFSTRFLYQHFAVEDFVTLSMGKKSCRWSNVMFGHGFDKLV